MSHANDRPLPTDGPTAGGDEFDDLFNYDADINDPFSDNYVVPGAKERQREKDAETKAKGGANLGIDEEVEVTRKPRAPRVKLDENRLLSANGIPKLRNRAKNRLKLKGKGHEYSDASKLLSFYQIWLDDLFPKARFLDALAMVEKMGHKKRVQMMRMDWINEGKPQIVNEEDTVDDPAPANENDGQEKTAPRIASIFEDASAERPKTPSADDNTGADVDMEDEDLYGATPRAVRQKPVEETVSQTDSLFGGTGASIFGPAKRAVDDFGPDEDELDALLAEEETVAVSRPVSKAPPQDEIDDDEMEAMNDKDMDGMW
ncbi:related to CSM3 Protein required for accurate chromosome segregation during meiosis [Rhynchosporium secalis]|uniref:Chromosome segregation in meiosis protein n=1 Tax=Rhynchosporium secalis TaxID=38038 RepID=A0A1E1MPG0_RHYSE|nr:related to CSM3 Protein required for accurate chromosome segregation during meiosis [Rhynchosporium secalis]